jgi:hypothetical protein
MKATPEQIAKLPKWAQDHINAITRERDISVRSLNEYCDSTTPSPFEISEYVCTGEKHGPSMKRRYIQAHTITVKWRGIELCVGANDYGHSGNGIRLTWSGKNGHDDCALIPVSHQTAVIKSKEDML